MAKAASRQRPTHKLMTGVGSIFGIILSYALVSRALSTGSYWQYLGGLVFLIFGIKLLIRFCKK
jgi:hypothetical protein